MRSHVAKTVSTCYSVRRQLRTIRRSFSRWCRLSSSRGSTTAMRYSPARRRFITSFDKDAVSVECHRSAYLFLVKVPAHHSALSSLHCLKAPEQIAFKQVVVVHKCLHGSAPAYLTDKICQVADVEARRRFLSSLSSNHY